MLVINDRERAFGSLLLNQMAFEYARDHCKSPLPEISLDILRIILDFGVPLVFDRDEQGYEDEARKLDGMNIAAQCFEHFGNIRHNLIHGNKAGILDDPIRLEGLLDWADNFAAEVFNGESVFSHNASHAKAVLGIENL